MGRRWVLSAIAVAAVAGLVFAIFPQWDLAIPGWFFDPVRGDFPLAIRWFPNLIRSIGHWTTLLIVLAAGGSLLAKILFPRTIGVAAFDVRLAGFAYSHNRRPSFESSPTAR